MRVIRVSRVVWKNWPIIPEQRLDGPFALRLLELKWVAEGGSQAGVAVPAAVPAGGQSRLAWGVAAVTTVLAIALAVLYLNRAPIETTTARLSVLTELGVVRGLVLSPDGRQLAFTDGSQLWIRPLDSLESQALRGTEEAASPFWSPDSRSIGFFTPGFPICLP